jgi:two-component system LytT family sensor kinase
MKNKILFILTWLTILIAFDNNALAKNYIEPSFGKYFLFDFNGAGFGVIDNQLFMAERYAQFGEKDKSLFIKSTILLGVKLNPDLKYFHGERIASVSKSYPCYIISDGSAAEVIAYGINKQNAGDYRYRIIENDSMVLVPWSKIALQQKHGSKRLYGFIGILKRPGRQLLVEVENIKEHGMRDGIVFDWRDNFTPIVTGMFVKEKRNSFDVDIYDPKTNKGYASKYNPQTGVPLNLKLPVNNISDLRISLKHHETIAYDATLIHDYNGKKDTILLVNGLTENNFWIDADKFSRPGKYIIAIWCWLSMDRPGQFVKIPFDVILPAPPIDKKVSISLKQALPYIIATLTGVVLLFGGYYRRNQVKLLRAAQEKQTAGLKLQSIRAQLNPHFMFNALTSIQNLVNKNDIAGANHYLSKFAGLTRQVLDTGNEELLSLEQELAILDDYLQMEQLRFGFEFKITVDSSINSANAEIPAMLLQPFAENAVKHGVAILKEKGEIEIVVTRQEKDLLFCITDNGKWINKSNDDVTSGYGLKLSEERVALLNQLYKEQQISLTITKQPVTAVCIRLSNWI